ncbi:hypothetical protein GP486_002911 [Trichoglossum hirsutum]|uniref:Activator of Hsp90 ATPase AHSA1-like N-terminal domain-containing protein n=1 Tax=Trichoglossum hirsutum TaxID=265104 RepID=A0A9P8LE70_9PEZI|nr:hypothetical protein GP486_002911 [Trichoglossum hirsutum]
MVLHNPNNWHWVNKDVSAWAKEYLEDSLTQISAEEGGVSAKVQKILSMDGDVDVSQRKGKVITLFDVRLQLEYTGRTADNEEVSGTITIPEVAHDTLADQYVFDIDIYSDGKSKQPVKDLVRANVVPQLREKLVKLGPALIAEHGKDIQHAPGSGPSSGTATPTYASSASASALGKPTSVPMSTRAETKGPLVNVTTVTDTEEFRTSAAELFQTFTDPQRLAAFTRSPPTVFEGAKKGGRFELFGGNVSGEFTTLEEPTKIIQLWRLKQWPTSHYSKLEITFDQNDQDAVTVMRVNWDGVPVGQEEVTKRNWTEYYVVSAEPLNPKITKCSR